MNPAEHVLRGVSSTCGTKTINERPDLIRICREVKELDVWSVLMIFVSNNGDPDFCLLEERKVDVVNNALDLLFGCVDVTGHRACCVNQEE